MIYGYCRISTTKQNIERQQRNIKELYPDAVIVNETFTGSKYQGRKELERLISKVRAGDKIIFDSVSRMSRNAEEGFALYERLYNSGVELVFLKEPHINTETYRQELKKQINISFQSGDNATDELMNTIVSALNKYILSLAQRQIALAFIQTQKEVDDLRQRTREGIQTARLKGKQIGGKLGKTRLVKKKVPIQEIIKKYSKDFGGSLKDTEVLAIIHGTGFKLCRNIYYKYKKELRFSPNSSPNS